ncbi:helix-turn-helix transcriptional regulator [Streptomyces sp. MUM 178J]|uniref:helix-turn-helix transcriptional regulator n=1 Tax=Streptomyces sp. MUM 178J TaxID=2791991 RepID=UPI001F047DEC|nr:LuxR C-terminal-related transcriptional regulator [Streptomyces sp. MUM 178J]WRQ81678.1 LuxR C-terminal-related transcriptional regulator [Streptomyces sp. MUM 178J]
MTGRLTVVIGPPGAGKTALLASWARSHVCMPGHTAWLTLDTDDNDAAQLLAHLEAALARIGMMSPDSVDRFSSGQRECEVSVSALLNAVSEFRTPIVLVLDGVHELRAGPALNALLQFTRYAPKYLRVVLASRREPGLPLHKLRALGELTEIRGSDLAFTREEAAVLFREHGAEAGEEQMARVVECSGGWALAVRYAAVHPVRGTSHQSCLEGWSQAVRSCSDFLISELLEPLPPEHQDVLLRTSVLTEFSASLVRALTGRMEAHRILRVLATHYDLLDRDDEWTYRLPNPLIRGVLSRELTERYGWDEVIRLLRTAADWHGEGGRGIKAAEYARAADTHAARPPSDTGIVFPPALATYQAGQEPAAGRAVDTATASPVSVEEAITRPSPSLSPGHFRPGAEDFEPLTPTELDVLRLLPRGLTLEEIAAQRHVSLNTVKSQVKAIYRKLRVSRRRDAVSIAAEHGVI